MTDRTNRNYIDTVKPNIPNYERVVAYRFEAAGHLPSQTHVTMVRDYMPGWRYEHEGEREQLREQIGTDKLAALPRYLDAVGLPEENA